MDPVRIFNLNGKTYKYERTLNADECTSIKTLSVLEKNKDGQDVFTPIIKQSKYGENAFSYENMKTGEVVLADNFRSRKVFDVVRRMGNNRWTNEPIGSIQDNKITVIGDNEKLFRLLKRIRGMIKSF
ncbi:MAG: hypothetical protein K6E29_08270 [Cyanobacteria bacterium RUI128]|nr:hypothetical protein [Cyanobacteria bacterium RUI128]